MIKASHTFRSKAKSLRAVIVVPCYNEEKRLEAESFLDFLAEYPELTLLFVDDGSSDATLGVLARLRAAAPQSIDVLALAENGGKAEAVRKGMVYASEGGADFVGFMDADLATPLEGINDLFRVLVLLDDIDVVMGSRSTTMGHRVYRHPVRKLISLACATLARLATGLPVKDTQCGAKMFRNTASLRNSIAEPFEAGWLFDVELLLRLSATIGGRASRFYEHALMEWTEVPGSKVGTSAIIRSGFVMIGLIFRRWQIKAKFRRSVDRHNRATSFTLRAHGGFDIWDLQAFRERALASDLAIELDLSGVSRFGPMVMSGLVGFADSIVSTGRGVAIYLPDDDAICAEADRSGLVALYNCSRVRAVETKSQAPTRAPALVQALQEVA